MRVYTKISLRSAAPGLIFSLAIAFGLGAAMPAIASSDEGENVDASTPAVHVPIDVWLDFKPVSFSNQSVSESESWRVKVSPPSGRDLRYLTLHFSDVSADSGKGFSLELRDADSRLLATYDSAFLAAHANFSTPPLKPGTITVQVHGPVNPGDLAFQVDKMRVAALVDTVIPRLPKQMGDAGEFLSLQPDVIGYNQMDAKQRKLARGVVLLTIANRHRCTGFLIEGNQIVTAYHCLKHSDDFNNSAGRAVRGCTDITIAFDYNDDHYGAVINPRCKAIDPHSYPHDDIAILQLDGQPPKVDPMSRTVFP